MIETISKYSKIRRELLQSLGRSTTEVAAEMGLPVDQVNHHKDIPKNGFLGSSGE